MSRVRVAFSLTGSRAGRAVAVLLLVAGLLSTSAVPAGAAPTVAENSDTAAVSAWPVDLQQLVNGTQAFSSAPWFTQGPCAGRGGNVAGYINAFFQRESAVRREIMRDLQQKAPDLIDDNAIAEIGAADAVFPNGNAAYEMPADTCADDLKAWTTSDDSSPWGFTWVSRPDPTSLQTIQRAAFEQPGDPTDVLDAVDPLMVCAGDNQKSYLCSRAFWVNCDVAAAADRARCQAWNTAVQRHLNGMNHWLEMNTSLADRVGEFLVAAGGVLVWIGGGWVISALGFLLGKLGDAIDWAAKKGMDQVVAFAVAGAVWLWGKIIGYLIDQTTPNLLGGGFVDLYNLISGIMMGLAFLIWLAGLVMAWKRGRLAGSIIGAVKAVVGIQVVGIIAWMMLELANQATKALIEAYVHKVATSNFTAAITDLYSPVAFVAAILLIFGLIGTAIVLVFQAPATIGHALFGTVGAAGQAHQATSHWMQRWFIRLLSLAWCKFFMVAMTLLAMNLIMPTAQNSTQNFGQQFFGVLLGLALMIMLPTTPWLLSGLMSFSVGHASRISDSIAMGLTEKLGKATMSAAAGAVSGAGAGAGDAGGGAAGGSAAGGSSKAALATMANNLSSLDSAGAGSGNGQSTSGDEQEDQHPDGDGSAESGANRGTGGGPAPAAGRSGGAGQEPGPPTGGAGTNPAAPASSGSSPRGSTGRGLGPGPLAAARGRGPSGVNPAGSGENEAFESGTGDATASPQGTDPRAPGGQPADAGAAAAGPGPSLRAASSATGGAAAAPQAAGAADAGSSGGAGSGSVTPVPTGTVATPTSPSSDAAPTSLDPSSTPAAPSPQPVIPDQKSSPGSGRRPRSTPRSPRLV